MSPYLLGAVLLMNGIAFAAMGLDKLFAIRQQRRIPEAHLHFLAAATGAIGIWLGLFLIRHKSQKRSFQRMLILATSVNFLWIWLYLRS